MATVRMADYRKRDIVKKAENKWDEVNPKRGYDPSVGEALFTEKLSKNIEKYEAFMEENFPELDVKQSEISELSIRFTKATEEEDQEDAYDTYRGSVPLTTYKNVPKALTTGYDTVELTLPPTHEAVIHYLDVKNFNESLDTRQYEYRTKIKDMLDKFPTLNQALRAFPSLEKLCDAEDVRKVHQKVDRTARRNELQEIAEEEGQELKEILLTSSLLGDDDE
tara:strand:+ start:3272 stop:3937 length:666 start_codon:yes stop_codon:yes gene_type:complete